jgi:acyl carrier protein
MTSSAVARRHHGMTKDQIITELRGLLRNQKQLKVDIDAIDIETRFDQIGFDSLSILDFMYEVENRFGTFPEMEELVKMQKVDDLVEFLAAHAKA